jgi:hypothetical protein
MNNSYGIVKQRLENGKLRCVVNTKIDTSVDSKYCEPVIQCQNKYTRNVPCMIWPKLAAEKFPRIHWLHEAPKNIFPESAFKENMAITRHCQDRFENGEFGMDEKLVNTGPPLWQLFDQPEMLLGKEIAKKTINYLKNVLNWKRPIVRPVDDAKFEGGVIIWYDLESTAKPNTYFHTILNFSKDKYRTSSNGNIMAVYDHKIRGPCVYFNYNSMLSKKFGETPINQLMVILRAHADVVLNPELDSDDYAHKRLFELERKIVEDRICDKIKGKQKCKECKLFLKKTNNPYFEMHVKEIKDIQDNDPVRYKTEIEPNQKLRKLL